MQIPEHRVAGQDQLGQAQVLGVGDLDIVAATGDQSGRAAQGLHRRRLVGDPADTDAVYGTATLEFGSFDEPTAIPVTVTDLYIEIASLVGESKESGDNTVQLRDGEPIFMLYDSVQNRFHLAEPEAIALNLDLENGLAGHQPATMYFEGKFTEEGRLAIFGQLVVNMTETAVLGSSWGATKSFQRQNQARQNRESPPDH